MSLPTSVSQAIEAVKALDASLFVSQFTDDATLIDESKCYESPKAITAWFLEALKGHEATVQVVDSGLHKEEAWVHVMMDGSFAADYGITEAFPLYFHFFLDDDDKVRLLRINQLRPEDPTMRAVWAAKGNNADPLSAIRCDIMKVPEVPEGWIRVKVVAAGLNYHDIFTLRGMGMFELKFPLILGNEAAGTLDDGTEVIIFPVMGNPDYKGDATLDPERHVLGELTQGSLAEYVVVPARNVVKKPKDMSFETASVMGIAWLTAYRMLFTRSGLKKGQRMLVQGSTGGVATALIQLGVAAGMEVWTTGRTAEKRAVAEKLGAHQTFEPGEALPEKVAAVFDMSGEKTFKHSMECLNTGGTLVCCGLHSGGKFAELDLMKLFTQGINVHGTYAGNREEFEALVGFVAGHKLEPYISEVLPLGKVEDGLRMMLEGKLQGKIVVKV